MTASQPVTGRTETRSRRPRLASFTRSIEEADALDRAAAKVAPAAEALVAKPRVRRLLQGQALGHALHPLLTDLPLGAWISTALLDVAGGPEARSAARMLTGFGVLSAVPTALTGWSEWAAADRVTRRVGLVHAGVNTAGLVLYTASWLARRSRHHGVGVTLGMLGGAGALVGGYLGGHMSLARKAGTHHEDFTTDTRPEG
jgi:uncharacterized membrane protein